MDLRTCQAPILQDCCFPADTFPHPLDPTLDLSPKDLPHPGAWNWSDLRSGGKPLIVPCRMEASKKNHLYTPLSPTPFPAWPGKGLAGKQSPAEAWTGPAPLGFPPASPKLALLSGRISQCQLLFNLEWPRAGDGEFLLGQQACLPTAQDE